MDTAAHKLLLSIQMEYLFYKPFRIIAESPIENFYSDMNRICLEPNIIIKKMPQKKREDFFSDLRHGSNIFNLLAVLSFPGIIQPAHLSQTVIWRDIPVMFVITMVLLSMNWMNSKNLTRWQGFFLLTIYFAYIGGLIIDAII